MKLPKPVILVMVWVLLGAAAWYVNFPPQVVPVPLVRSFSQFPFVIDGWKGAEKKVSELPKLGKGIDDGFVRDYVSASGDPVELSFAYFTRTQEGKTPIPPQSSWVPDGWAFKDLGEARVAFKDGAGSGAVIKKILADKYGHKVILFYAYRINGKYTADFTMFKAWTAIDSLLKRKNSAFMVQLVSLPGAQGLEKKEAEMTSFLAQALSVAEADFLS